MFDFRRVTHEDHQDVLEICKDIWDGADYLPELFHSWVEDTGFFLAAVDKESNRVLAFGKYSVFPDGTGWLEGLRVHSSFRGLKISNEITDRLLDIAKRDLSEGIIKRIAYSTHGTNKQSIHLMGERGFKLKERYITVFKDFKDIDTTMDIKEFNERPWDVSFEEFKELTYLKRRNNIFSIAFIFQRPTRELYDAIKKNGGFVEINGKRGIYKYKGEPNFVAMDDDFHAINTFANYYGLKHRDKIKFPPLTTILPEDYGLIESLKKNNYTVWFDWEPDYLYFEYNE